MPRVLRACDALFRSLYDSTPHHACCRQDPGRFTACLHLSSRIHQAFPRPRNQSILESIGFASVTYRRLTDGRRWDEGVRESR